MNPKVSIIICTRARPELLLKRALFSVAAQTYKDYETIVIENPSGVKYPPMPKWVRYYKNKKDIGLAGSKNRGLKLAKGEYIVFLDDDNEFHADFLQSTVGANISCDMMSGWKRIVYPEGVAIHRPKMGCSINDGFIIKKKIAREIGFDEKLMANEDADFGIRLWDRKQLIWGHITRPIMTAYASPIINTTSYSNYTDEHLDGLCDFWKKHHKYEEYIGRMFMLRSGKKWFRWLFILEQKIKRYHQIWLSRKPR